MSLTSAERALAKTGDPCIRSVGGGLLWGRYPRSAPEMLVARARGVQFIADEEGVWETYDLAGATRASDDVARALGYRTGSDYNQACLTTPAAVRRRLEDLPIEAAMTETTWDQLVAAGCLVFALLMIAVAWAILP